MGGTRARVTKAPPIGSAKLGRALTALSIGIFLLAGAVLLLEVALTRVFAIMLWHHLAYMVIAVAMLGFGAAGSLLTLRGARPGTGAPAGALAALASGFGVSALVALMLATRLPVDTLALWTDKSNLLRLGLLYTVLFVPFLLGGAGIGLLLSRLASRVNQLYFFDLLGSAAGEARACGCWPSWEAAAPSSPAVPWAWRPQRPSPGRAGRGCARPRGALGRAASHWEPR